MREHKENSGPAGPEASKKGWEGPSLPRLGRKGKIVRNLLLTAVFAACIWGQYGCPLPTAELNFRRLEHKYLMEPSQIVFSQSGERDFQAEDGTWLSLSRTAVVGVGEEWVTLGYNQRAEGPMNALDYFPREEGPTPVPMGELSLWWVPRPGETAVSSPLLLVQMPEGVAFGELEVEVTYRDREVHRDGLLFDLGDGVWMGEVESPEEGYTPDWMEGGTYCLRLYDVQGALLLRQWGTIPEPL